MHARNRLDYRYLESADEQIEIGGQLYTAIVHTLTRGRSDPVAWWFSYLRLDDSIFYVHKTKNSQPRLVDVKAVDPQSFVAVSYDVAKDQRYVYARGKRVTAIKNVVDFRVLDQEVEIYFDGTLIYDRILKPLAVHHATFALIPFCNDNRIKLAEAYNLYLKQIGKPPLPLECSLMYSPFACDQQSVYQRNQTTGSLWPVGVETLKDTSDIHTFAECNPHIKAFGWYRAISQR